MSHIHIAFIVALPFAVKGSSVNPDAWFVTREQAHHKDRLGLTFFLRSGIRAFRAEDLWYRRYDFYSDIKQKLHYLHSFIWTTLICLNKLSLILHPLSSSAHSSNAYSDPFSEKACFTLLFLAFLATLYKHKIWSSPPLFPNPNTSISRSDLNSQFPSIPLKLYYP